MQTSASGSGRNDGKGSEDFAALFAMLDAVPDPRTTNEGYQILLSRIESTRFKRETLSQKD